MKVILSLATLMFVGHVYAAECNKEQAQVSVEKVCVEYSKSLEAGNAFAKKYRYCGQNYVWVQDTDVKMIIHPIKRRLNGKDLKGYKDKKGKAIFVEFDKSAKANTDGGWVDYVWPKPGEESASPKVSFVKKCTEGVIVGSGIWK